MLSPDETVQLLANVVQKMAVNQTQQVIDNQQTTNNPNMSMISNEDILKQALQLCNQQNAHNVTMPPLQMTHSTVNTNLSGLPPQQNRTTAKRVSNFTTGI